MGKKPKKQPTVWLVLRYDRTDTGLDDYHTVEYPTILGVLKTRRAAEVAVDRLIRGDARVAASKVRWGFQTRSYKRYVEQGKRKFAILEVPFFKSVGEMGIKEH